MKLDFIPLDRLVISKANMRHGKKPSDVTDILPTVRRRGVLQPVIVRPNCAPGHFEIVAGRRRFHAAQIVAEERRGTGDAPAEIAPLPCAILDEGDDADAIEASMIENMARLDPDEVTQWETFTRLVREGRKVEDIAVTFGLPDLAVRRVLALGNLLPAIRDLYRREEIDAATVRHLTMASKSQQRAWLALADDDSAYLPTGHQLKAWLLGGQSIPARHALFDVDAAGLATIADLFGEDRYIVDAEAFWTHQHAAIDSRRTAALEAGWADAVVVPTTAHFSTWEYEKAGKRKGGRVYFDVRANGEVIVHEGYVSRKEAARLARAEGGDPGGAEAKPARPEVTAAMQTYIDLHRHAAVRAALLDHPGHALRLMLAHAIVGSHLWSVRVEPQRTANDEVRHSLDNSRAGAVFAAAPRRILALLGFAPDAATVTGGADDDLGVVGVFHRLFGLDDSDIMAVSAVVIGETLAAGSAAVAAVGAEIGVDMASWWQADDAFFAGLRDREVLTRIVAEVAGETVANANAGEPAKTVKAIVRDHLDGTNGRPRCDNWVPRWMAFPPAAYTARGGVGTVAAHDMAMAARDAAMRSAGGDDPDPADIPEPAALPAPEGERGFDSLAA